MAGVDMAGGVAARRASDRFLGFAFAAAEMLTELDPAGRIAFAAGAFAERFGQPAEAFLGAPVARLVAPEDQGVLELGLSLLAARGRIAPMAIRLGAPGREVMALSGLLLPECPEARWLTWARLPSGAEGRAAPADGVTAPDLRRALEGRIRAAEPACLGLLDIGAWSDLAPAVRREVSGGLAAAVRDVSAGAAQAGALADGRFGVLGPAELDIRELQDRVARILRAAGVSSAPNVAAMRVGEAAVTAGPALRAMRFALTTFTRRGAEAVRAEGFDGGLRGFLRRAETEAAGARAAIEAGRFRVVFQPVVRLADRRPHHFEALLRPYPVPGRPELDTQGFVTFAEAIGLAETLDGAVMERVAGVLTGPGPRVAVNVSGLSLQSGTFVERLTERVERAPALAARLMLELTETADIEDVGAAIDAVARLSAAGVEMCLDDFGAGHAAFQYLRAFRVGYVKIDGSYVRGARPGNRDYGFIGAMVELARCVGARTIAEMVETEAQAAMVAELGVEYGQGWLFGRPGGLPGAL